MNFLNKLYSLFNISREEYNPENWVLRVEDFGNRRKNS